MSPFPANALVWQVNEAESKVENVSVCEAAQKLLGVVGLAENIVIYEFPVAGTMVTRHQRSARL